MFEVKGRRVRLKDKGENLQKLNFKKERLKHNYPIHTLYYLQVPQEFGSM